MQLTWAAPADAGGLTVLDYFIESSVDGTTWTAIDDGLSATTGITVGDLTNGTTYSFRVAAANALGAGLWSDVVTATPTWTPTASSAFTAAVAPTAGVGSGHVKLTWNAPAATGGAAITDYVIQRSTNGITWTTVNDGVSTVRSYLVRGLTNGTQYRMRVAARNAVGQGPWSDIVRATPHAR